MSVQEVNKAVIGSFLQALGRHDVEVILSYLSEDVVFETRAHFHGAAKKNRAEFANDIPFAREMLPDGIEYTIEAMTAEDDRVHVECSGCGKTFDGVSYNNFYHLAFRLRDGKITQFRDYMDTDYLLRVMRPAMERRIGLNVIWERVKNQMTAFFGASDPRQCDAEKRRAGLENVKAAFGSEEDPARRLDLWRLLHELESAPDPDLVFSDPAARREAAAYSWTMARYSSKIAGD